jgi:hypothetical protein
VCNIGGFGKNQDILWHNKRQYFIFEKKRETVLQ